MIVLNIADRHSARLLGQDMLRRCSVAELRMKQAQFLKTLRRATDLFEGFEITGFDARGAESRENQTAEGMVFN